MSAFIAGLVVGLCLSGLLAAVALSWFMIRRAEEA